MGTFSSQFYLYLVVVLLLTMTVVTETFGVENPPTEPEFLSWGSRCKIPKGGERFNEQCDQGRGMGCQKYGSGYRCGCTQENTGEGNMSYDHQSKECRIKVRQFCSVGADFIGFSSKCHERAECKTKPSSSKPEQGNLIKTDDTATMCFCKEGYLPSEDLTRCNSPNSAATTASHFLYGLSLLSVLIMFQN